MSTLTIHEPQADRTQAGRIESDRPQILECVRPQTGPQARQIDNRRQPRPLATTPIRIRTGNSANFPPASAITGLCPTV